MPTSVRRDPDEQGDPEARLLATDLHVEATSRLMEALVESENRMRRRLELLADAVIETDEDGMVVFLNPAWVSLTGLPVQACLGLPLADFFPPDGRLDVERVLAERGGDHQELVTSFVHLDGATVRVALTTSPIATGGVVAVLRDVTRELAYQEELSKLSVVASSTSNLVIITDAEGRIDWVNPAFEQRTGYSLAEVRGLTPGSFLQGEDTDKDAVERLRVAVREHTPASEELLNYAKSGEAYWVTVNLTPVIDVHGELERFISVQDDITERKRVELLKNQFVSTVSHELRTPLTAIGGALGLLTGGVAGPLPERAKPLLDIAQKNGERLTMLIDDLLDMDRLVEGGMPIETEVHELMHLIDLAIKQNQPYADKFGVSLRVVERCEGVRVDVDSLRLMQVMSNLLSNACKFSPPGSAVDVVVCRIEETVRVSVTDRGPGIPDAFRDVMFEKFSQADGSDTRTRGGTGLGLAISKELIERMGGGIGFESTVGVGSTFFFDLPAH